ncbi:hypothetical protein [Enterococcus gilvus]|uniref:hypothetical protein n=1 Tax=Enterococcus gilvus TaxID=160453 RepID=UPI00345EDCD8
MNLRDQINLNLEVHGDIEFIFENNHYFIGWNRQEDGYAIRISPGNELAVSHTDNWSDALDQPIFRNELSINDVFDQVKFTALTV